MRFSHISASTLNLVKGLANAEHTLKASFEFFIKWAFKLAAAFFSFAACKKGAISKDDKSSSLRSALVAVLVAEAFVVLPSHRTFRALEMARTRKASVEDAARSYFTIFERSPGPPMGERTKMSFCSAVSTCNFLKRHLSSSYLKVDMAESILSMWIHFRIG